MSIKTQIERLETAKADIVTAITEKGVIVSNGVLLDDIPGYISLLASNYLQQEIDSETAAAFLIQELDGETTGSRLEINFN